MTAVRDSTTEVTLTLTGEERSLLRDWLEQTLQLKLIEEHRTDAPDYKAIVRREESILESIINKLRAR